MSHVIEIPGQEPLRIPGGTVGINISGGADSALLLHVLLSQTSAPVHVFTTVSTWLDCCEITFVKNIIGYFETRYPARVQQQTIVFANSYQHLLEIINKQPYLCLYKYRSIDSFMHATTLIPTQEQQSEAGFPPLDNAEISTRRNPHVEHATRMGPGWFGPFKNINKKQVAELYAHYDIQDLFGLTRSCTESVSHCGECWWCHERKWAFGRL